MKFPFRSDAMLNIADPSKLNIWHESYDAAVAESQQTGKPILADFTGSDWCHWCTKLKQDVFETTTFKNWAQENVVLLELDYPQRGMQDPTIKQQNRELASHYQIQSYPTVLLLNSNGEVLGKFGYHKDAAVWIEQVENQLSGAAVANVGTEQ